MFGADYAAVYDFLDVRSHSGVKDLCFTIAGRTVSRVCDECSLYVVLSLHTTRSLATTRWPVKTRSSHSTDSSAKVVNSAGNSAHPIANCCRNSWYLSSTAAARFISSMMAGVMQPCVAGLVVLRRLTNAAMSPLNSADDLSNSGAGIECLLLPSGCLACKPT